MAKKTRVSNPKTIGDLMGGDIVVVGEDTVRLMIPVGDAWGCRKQLESGEWTDTHHWFTMDVPIQRVVKLQNYEASKGSSKDTDPMMRR